MKKTLILFITFILVLSSIVIVASGRPENEGQDELKIPAHAKQVRSGVFYLGKAFDNGKIVEGYAFIRYKKEYAKPQPVCGNNICESREKKSCPQDCVSEEPPPETGLNTSGDSYDLGNANCYTYMGAKWNTIEPYLIKTRNKEGLDAEMIKQAVAYAIGEWEDAASGIINDAENVNILGDLTGGRVNGADTGLPDGKNEILFGNVNYAGAIAITIVWATNFDGNGEIVEWDQVYDQTDYDWSLNGEVGKMDFLNIAIHELGHSLGIGDLYENNCNLETMYGYAEYAEINKRTLAIGDVVGVSGLY